MRMIGSLNVALEVASLAEDTHREHEGDEDPGAISTRRVRHPVGIAQEFPPERGQAPVIGWIDQRRSRRPAVVPLSVADTEGVDAPDSVEDEILEAIDSRRSGNPPAWQEPYQLMGDELLSSPHYRTEERAPLNTNDTEDSDTVTTIGPAPIAPPPRSRRPVIISPVVSLAWTDDD